MSPLATDWASFLCEKGVFTPTFYSSLHQMPYSKFLRATAVPAGTAEARISYGDSVCLSVCHKPVPNEAQVR